MKNLLFLILLIIPLKQTCQKTTEGAISTHQNIEEYLLDMINVHKIPGMSVGVIKDGSVIHKGFYGTENLESNKAISNETLFKVFSLTKIFVATGIFQLIEQGKLSLSDPLSLHFEGLPKKWNQVTIANLLSHSSGLPDIRQLISELENDAILDKELIEMLYNDEMEFPTSSQWNYNQTNYILLKVLIEKVSKSKFESFILNHQFPTSNPEDVLFSSGTDNNVSNQATYYNFDRDTESFTIKKEFSGQKNHPLAGMNLTLDEYILWNQRLDNNLFFSNDTKQAMWTKFNFTESDRQFMHGWDVYSANDYQSIGFSGGGVSGYRKFVDNDISIIVLTTGFQNYSVQNTIIDHIAGVLDSALYDENASIIEQVMGKYFLSDTTIAHDAIIAKVKTSNPKASLEEVFNSIGFTLFFQLDRKDDAIDLFKLNASEYPDSYDAFGSLAYLYFLTEEYVLARKNYLKAFELNPENDYSERRIQEIDSILKDKKQ